LLRLPLPKGSAIFIISEDELMSRRKHTRLTKECACVELGKNGSVMPKPKGKLSKEAKKPRPKSLTTTTKPTPDGALSPI
jgi:hypothetical protein